MDIIKVKWNAAGLFSTLVSCAHDWWCAHGECVWHHHRLYYIYNIHIDRTERLIVLCCLSCQSTIGDEHKGQTTFNNDDIEALQNLRVIAVDKLLE